MTQMQGIVSILRSDNPEKTTKAASLRRTLSADMSSKRWLGDNGLPAMKKIASSEQIAVVDSSYSSSESDEEECVVVGSKSDENIPTRMDIWTAIMSQKKQEDSGEVPPLYVHPLVKKSASSLSEKSLKICTESLGSETGSDVFSSYPSSDVDDDGRKEQSDEHKVVKLPCLTTKTPQHASVGGGSSAAAAPRSFPPPLQSLASARTDGAPSLHMHSRRVDGRLVLEAVSVPQQKYFEAQRHDGRFLLTLVNNPKEELPSANELSFSKVVEEKNIEEELQSENEFSFSDVVKEKNIEEELLSENEFSFSDMVKEKTEEDEDHEVVNGVGILKHRSLNSVTGVLINVHKSTVTIKKLTKRDNENSLSQKLSKLQVVEEEEETSPPMIQSLARRPPRASGLPPLPPPSSTTTTFNSYQYFWRAKPTVASVIDPLITQHRPPTKTKDLVLLRGNKADCLLLSSKGCKEPRRSFLLWEPFCIATS